MQTFLPYPDFSKTAEALDYRRLGKQRVETLQILKVLAGETRGWRNHPAVLMWHGSENTLVEYGVAICKEWKSRGYKDTCEDRIRSYTVSESSPPNWLGNKDFHTRHQSRLVQKDYAYYKPLFPEVDEDLEYVWPEGNE